MSAPDYEGLAERLDAITTSDHERGCQGREYACSCGWDEETMAISTEAAAAIRHLIAERDRLEEAVKAAFDERRLVYERKRAVRDPFEDDTCTAWEKYDFACEVVDYAQTAVLAALSGRKEP